ncbi:MAG: hypothetical protein JWP12_2612 [Bacteroidetes bacterium]|nr:hypothetical protein [Bacteroidota bacterium]
MKFLLKIKHWQLFVLLIGLPFIAQITMVIAMAVTKNMYVSFIVFPVMMIFLLIFFFGWFYALGTNLHKKLPENLQMNITRFKAFLFVPVGYMTLLFVFVLVMIAMSPRIPNPAILILIIPLHLFSMFCIFYSMYFVSKTLRTVELQRELTFSDYAGEFFLIWFFPIGIWFIQPRINKLFENE